MKTTDRASDRITSPQSPRHRWFRVRPVFRWTLALCLAGWCGLFIHQETRDLVLGQQLGAVAQWAKLHAPAALNVLAVGSVLAAVAEAIRSSRSLTKVRRTLVRSMRISQRLVLGSRAA